MNYPVLAIGVSALLFILMLVFIDIGRRIGRKRRQDATDTTDEGFGNVDAAVFGLLGLVLAFTYSGAANRLDIRRAQIVQEANAIGTAYLRVDILSPSEQPEIRKLFRQYLDSRIEVYELINSSNSYSAAQTALDKSNRLQTEIWSRAISACRSDPNHSTCMLTIPALNDMIDITTTRTMAMLTHAPTLILALLVLLSLLAALLAGYSMSKQAKRSNMHTLLFALAIAMSVYTVLDLEYPRFGLINLRDMDRSIIQLRDMIK